MSELERNGGGVEVDEVRQKWSVEGGFPGGWTKGRQKERGQEGGRTMTSPPSYAATSWSGVAPLRHWGQREPLAVVEAHGESGCRRWNSSTAAGAWTSVWGSHMLSECDQPMNLTRYHNLPHLNLESRTSSTLYSSWLSTMMGPGCGGCGH